MSADYRSEEVAAVGGVGGPIVPGSILLFVIVVGLESMRVDNKISCLIYSPTVKLALIV